MPTFLVETYLARTDVRARRARERRAHVAAADLASAGSEVRFDRTIHVPEDEICFFVFEAPSSRAAALAAERAGLDAVRIVAAVTTGDTAKQGGER